MRWMNAQLAKKPIEPGMRISMVAPPGLRRALTCQNEDNETNQGRVAHIEHCASEAAKAHTSRPEDESVHKDIATSHAGTSKGAPLPPVVLSAEQEINQQNGGGGRRDYHQTVAKEEKAKHVVDFAGPQRGHDEIELDEDRTEWKDASQQD